MVTYRTEEEVEPVQAAGSDPTVRKYADPARASAQPSELDAIDAAGRKRARHGPGRTPKPRRGRTGSELLTDVYVRIDRYREQRSIQMVTLTADPTR